MMRRTWKRGILAAILGLAFASPAFPADVDSIRCPGGIIHLRNNEHEVLSKCGAPTYRDGYGGYKWFYDRGSTEFNVIVHVQDGQVTYIEVQDE